MKTREWLNAELKKEQKHWDGLLNIGILSIGSSCKDLMDTARGFYNQSHSDDDMKLWEQAVDKAQEYIDNKKDGKYHRITKGLSVAGAAEARQFAEEKDEKTNAHQNLVNQHRDDIIQVKFVKRKLAVTEAQKLYEVNDTPEKFKAWQTELSGLIDFCKENNVKLEEVNSYQADFANAKISHEQKYSLVNRLSLWCDSACKSMRSVFCCAAKNEGLDSQMQIQDSDSVSTPAYQRMS